MTASTSPGLTRLTVGILGLVLLGTPLVAYLWHTLNDLLQGQVHAARLLWSVPAALLLAGLLWITWRQIGRWEADRKEDQR